MENYKYYSKEILKYLLLAGAICIAASSPYFASRMARNFFCKKPPKRKFYDSFNYLKRRKLIILEREGCDISVKLTKEGKRLAGKYQIDDLKIQKPKKWDGNWRFIIFDIPNSSRTIRDIFRKKLKEFGFYRLQQSIWVFPYPCKKEILFLRNFLGVSRGRIQIIEGGKLERDDFLRKYFNL